MASQRYHSAPLSDSSTVGVNQTARSMLSRCASVEPPANSANFSGQVVATMSCTRCESTASRCPSATLSRRPTAKVIDVCSSEQSTGGRSAVGATASSTPSR